MSHLDNLISELTFIADHPGKAVKDSIVQTGKKAIGCFPVYTPDELIYAAGMLPVGLWGGTINTGESSKYLQTFCCSIMKANLENGLSGAYSVLEGVMTTTYCDTLKCMGEVWKAAFPDRKHITFVCAQNRKTPEGKAYLTAELQRIKRTLEALSGNEITEDKLEESIAVYNDYRASSRQFVKTAARYPDVVTPLTRHKIIKAAYFMDKKRYTNMLQDLIDELGSIEEKKTEKQGVILTGLIAESEMVLAYMESQNLYVAGDMLVHESMQFNDDVAAGHGSAIERIADRFAAINGCALLYEEHKKKGEMLVDLVRETGAKGVIICQLKFCDPEEFDYPIYVKALKSSRIPNLYLEIEQSMDSAEQIRTRLQTFAEMLS